MGGGYGVNLPSTKNHVWNSQQETKNKNFKSLKKYPKKLFEFPHKRTKKW